ncbi:hypothetical protein BpHYR1_050509 [Brachionus plicatilis]|uniref:Uncharacterized protein n=1 Tax=Brachionus plicatilis TaxID=10195 RepID=A0A3M7S8G1_BRAPC|nr:hypothetical protein BpHYR1_050509 [Brachionus plicatilis]
MSCCCYFRPKCTYFIEPKYVDKCNCCLSEELNLIKLKKTNYELKYLINRLDHLSTSFEKYKEPKCWKCHDYYKQCNLCQSSREKNNRHFYEYNVTICNDCERMLEVSSELEARQNYKKDPNIYPLERYHSGKSFYCDKCDRCVGEKKRFRSRSRSRNSSSSRAVTPEPRAVWNGGPWVAYYPMTSLKLAEMKK